MTLAQCSCCSATDVVRSSPSGSCWCTACVDAFETVRRSLRQRLSQALAAGDQTGARIAQGALLLLLRGLHGRAPR